MPHKIYVWAANGAHQIVPENKTVFSEIKYSRASLKIDMATTLYFEIYHLILSQFAFLLFVCLCVRILHSLKLLLNRLYKEVHIHVSF